MVLALILGIILSNLPAIGLLLGSFAFYSWFTGSNFIPPILIFVANAGALLVIVYSVIAQSRGEQFDKGKAVFSILAFLLLEVVALFWSSTPLNSLVPATSTFAVVAPPASNPFQGVQDASGLIFEMIKPYLLILSVLVVVGVFSYAALPKKKKRDLSGLR